MCMFENTIGALLVGGFVTAVIFGVTWIQGVTYFRNCKEDKTWTKHMVAILFVVDATHFVFVCHTVY